MLSLKSILAATAVTSVLSMPFADLHEAELRERGEVFNETLLLEKCYTTANSVHAFPLLLQYMPLISFDV